MPEERWAETTTHCSSETASYRRGRPKKRWRAKLVTFDGARFQMEAFGMYTRLKIPKICNIFEVCMYSYITLHPITDFDNIIIDV